MSDYCPWCRSYANSVCIILFDFDVRRLHQPRASIGLVVWITTILSLCRVSTFKSLQPSLLWLLIASSKQGWVLYGDATIYGTRFFRGAFVWQSREQSSKTDLCLSRAYQLLARIIRYSATNNKRLDAPRRVFGASILSSGALVR